MAKKAPLLKLVFNKYLFGSIWPIIKATFKEPFIKKVKGAAFFTPKMSDALSKRVKSISSQSKRQWGTMTPEQMLHHLNLATGAALGYFNLPDESYLMSRTISKWMLIDMLSEQPKGLLIPLDFKIPLTEKFDLEQEKKLLLEIINKACKSKTTADWGPHPLFGRMSDNEWGRLYTMHIDYHLKQFGA
ncbi:MAG: DUF1569 domain-containing protein [Flavobacterium sp.]